MKTHWNGIDWGLLILVLCLLTGGVYLGRRRPWERGDRETVVCVLKSTPIDRKTHDVTALTASGDAVYLPAGGERIGEVLAVSVVPCRVLRLTDGGLRYMEEPELAALEVTVRLSLENRRLGAKRVAAGGTADLILGRFLAAGCEILTLRGEGNA